MSDEGKKIHRASLLLMASMFLSRVIGFFREWVLAQTLGASRATDIYLTSFTIPDFINHLMAAGALSISFIPILSTYITNKKGDVGRDIFRAVSTYLGGLLVLLILIAEIFARPLSSFIAPGFAPEDLDLLTQLVRIILPAQLFFYWGSLAVAVQHTHGQFVMSAVAPLIYNLGIVLCGLALNGVMGVKGFSIGVTAGAFLGHGVLQWVAIRKLGYSIVPLWRLSAEVMAAIRRYLYLSIPIALGFSLVVADEWFTKYFGSQLEPGAISWLSYARIEMRIPIAILANAAGIASFPFLARMWSEKRYLDYGNMLVSEIQKLGALASMAAVLLYVHAQPITHFIFGGGRLGPIDISNTATALSFYGLGVVFWSLQTLLSRGFYASHRTWLPSIVGSVLSVLAFPVYYVLMQRFSFRGLALAGSLGITVYSLILAWLLFKHVKRVAPEISFRPLSRFMGGWALVLVAVYLISSFVSQLGIYQYTRMSAFFEVALSGVICGAVLWFQPVLDIRKGS